MLIQKMCLTALALSLALTALAGSQEDYFNSPGWLGQQYLSLDKWQELDALVEKLAASGERDESGHFQLATLARNVDEYLNGWSSSEDEDISRHEQLAQYQKQLPASAYAPILEAVRLHKTAWRARGRFRASTVTPEGWKLFHERNQVAWQAIQAAKKQSSRLPLWYDEALTIGRDAEIPDKELAALLNEGVNRFPDYYPLYFTYGRQFTRDWGGDYDAADVFIKSQTISRKKPDSDVLYTRLYWWLDQMNDNDSTFFTESKVDWSRMRTGFERMLEQYPSGWNIANLVAFACRAGDGATYAKWRPKVEPAKVAGAARGITVDVCDARFTRKT